MDKSERNRKQRLYRKRYKGKTKTVLCPECGLKREVRKRDDRTEIPCSRCSRIILTRQTVAKNGGHGNGWRGSKYFSGQWYGYLTANAKKRGLKYTVSREYLDDLWEAQNGLCALTGYRMTTKTHDPYKRSLDRIRPDEGYVPGNVQFVVWFANQLKSSHSQEKLAEICRAIIKTLEGKSV